MVDELVPDDEGAVAVDIAETGDKMVFPRPNGTFSGVTSVLVRWRQLEVDIRFMHEPFEQGAGLVVESL